MASRATAARGVVVAAVAAFGLGLGMIGCDGAPLVARSLDDGSVGGFDAGADAGTADAASGGVCTTYQAVPFRPGTAAGAVLIAQGFFDVVYATPGGVYAVTSTGEVWRLDAISRCAQRLASIGHGVTASAIDGTALYLAGNRDQSGGGLGAVWRVPLVGGGSPELVFTTPDQVHGLAAAGEVFVSLRALDDFRSSIWAVGVTDGSARVILMAEFEDFRDLFVVGGALYASGLVSLIRLDLATGASTAVFDGPADGHGVDGDRIVFSDRRDRGLYELVDGLAKPALMGHGLGDMFTRFTFDASGVLVVEGGFGGWDGAVVRHRGGRREVLVDGFEMPEQAQRPGIALDDAYIYVPGDITGEVDGFGVYVIPR